MREFLARLHAVYGPPFGDTPDQFYAEYTRILGRYSAPVLEKAADLILTRHKGPHRWPRIAECVAACEDIIVADGHDKRLKERARDPYPEWTPAAQAQADRLIQCELGRQAAREGWITPLWDYCRKAGELPNRSQIPRLMADARKFDEAYGKTREGTPLRALGDSMLERRNRLSAIADPTHRHPAGSDA